MKLESVMEEQEREALENDPILKRLRQSRFKKVAKCLHNVSSCLLSPDLLVSQAFCIFLYGAFGAITPYLPLYLKEYGLAPYQVGIILGLGPIVQCLVSPIWGILAGKWHAQKLVFVSGVLSFLVKLLLFLAVQPHKQYCLQSYINSTSNLTYSRTVSLKDLKNGETSVWNVQAPVNTMPTTTISPTTLGSRINHNALKDATEDLKKFARIVQKQYLEDVDQVVPYSSRHLLAAQSIERFPSLSIDIYKTTSRWDPMVNNTVIHITTIDQVEVYDIFLIFVLFVLVCDFLQAPTFGLGDGSVFYRLKDNFRTGPTKMHLTRTLGWIAAVFVVGAIISGSGFFLCGSFRFSYYTAFYFSIGFVCMAFINALWFEYIYDQNTETETDIWKSSFQNICKLEHFSFLICLFYISLSSGFLEPFLNWYIDDLSGSTLVVATVCATRVMVTFIFYQIGKTMVPTLGINNVVLFSLMAYAVCLFCYWLMKNVWIAVGIVAIEGIAFAFLWRSCDEFVSRLKTSNNVKDLTKGLMETLFWGIGPGLGAITGGALYGWLGRTTFCALGTATIIVLVLLGAVYYSKAKDDDGEDDDEEEEYPDDKHRFYDSDEFEDHHPPDTDDIEADKSGQKDERIEDDADAESDESGERDDRIEDDDNDADSESSENDGKKGRKDPVSENYP